MSTRAPAATVIQWANAVGRLLLWSVFLLPPLVVAYTAKDPFRLPKSLATEVLALACLFFLSWKLLLVKRWSLRGLWQVPAVQALLPLVVVASLGLVTSAHPFHTHKAVWSLWIGALCVVGWSLALPRAKLERVLVGLLWPAALLGGLGILQFHDLFRPFDFVGRQEQSRIGITSLAGSVGDLGAYLVLPCLVAQLVLWRGWAAGSFRSGGGSRPGSLKRAAVLRWAGLLAVCLYAVAVTQTLTALFALGAASLVLWFFLVRRKRIFLLSLLSLGLVVAGALVVTPLGKRGARIADQLGRGNLDAVLTGRLDGWKAGAWMFQEHPWLGVGHGGYAAEFSRAKLALLEEGASLYRGHGRKATFGNAHNELVEALAEWGVLGVFALGWLGWVVLRVVRRLGGGENRGTVALAWAGLTAYALLSLGYMPLRIALVAYPALLWLAWLFADNAKEPRGAADPQRAKRQATGPKVAFVGPAAAWLMVVCLALGLGLRWRDAGRRLAASRLLFQAERSSQQMLSAGQRSRRLLEDNLAKLRQAQRLDPSEVGIPLAVGSHYLLLDRYESAADWYRRALELEPRPEIYLNLGRSLDLLGDEEARHNYELAVKLSPRLAAEAPPDLR